jgi:hypothetical protein
MLAAKLAGKSTAAIARAERLSRQWARREMASDDCRQIIVELVDADVERIAKLFSLALDTIEDAFGAVQLAQFQGCPVELGPDHWCRLAAAKRLLELVAAGRPMPKPPEDLKRSGKVTLPELEALLAANHEKAVQ